MKYSEVFKKAWNYVWKHKALWVFAFFAGSLVGMSFSFPGVGGQAQHRFNGNDINNQFPPALRGPMAEWWQNIRSVDPWVWVWVVIAIVVVCLLLTALSLLIQTAGRGGLIKGLLLAEDRLDGTRLRFNEAWKAMKPYFWRLLWPRLVLGVGLGLLGAISTVLFVVATIGTLGLILCLLIPLALIAIPVNWFIQAVVANASIALVDEDLGVFKAISRSWQIVSKNIGSVLQIMLFNFLINLATGLAALFPLVLATIPLIITMVLQNELTTGLWVLSGILLAVAFVISCLVGTWSNMLTHGIFVVAYRYFKQQESFNTPPEPVEPIVVVEVDETNETDQWETPTIPTPEEPTGNEPASQEPDEASQPG